jgi:chemotaxis protein MotB
MLHSLYRYSRSPLPVVVVKRRRRDAPQPTHSGAWKVAYADFVTAMMALFLLLWLLNVTDAKQRDAISSYFDPSNVSNSASGANGVLGGKTIIEDGSKSSTDKITGVQMPTPGAPDTARRNDDQNNPGNQEKRTVSNAQALDSKLKDEQAAAKLAAEHESQHFKEAEAALKQAIQAMPELQPLARNLIVDETPEGLRIQLVDQDGASMFALGSTDPLDHTRKLLGIIERSIAALPNKISIRGHTDGAPYRGGIDHYNNWDLSTDRANAARRVLEAAGLPSDRVSEVIGKADKDMLFPDKPLSPENRRISIILLREAPLPTVN